VNAVSWVISAQNLGHLFPVKVGRYDLGANILLPAFAGLRRGLLRASVFALLVSASVAQQPPPVAPAVPEPTYTGVVDADIDNERLDAQILGHKEPECEAAGNGAGWE